MPRGGLRKGAGVKKGTKQVRTLAKEAAREEYQRVMTGRFAGLLSAQYQTACGISQMILRDAKGQFKVLDDPKELEKAIEDGSAIEIFTRLPNAQAQTDILNRIMDKPKEQAVDVHVSHTLDQKILDILQSGRKRLNP